MPGKFDQLFRDKNILLKLIRRIVFERNIRSMQAR
jgi:hypothetical protein